MNARGLGTRVTLNNTSIQTTGPSSLGINVNNQFGGDAGVTLTNGTITTNADNSHGLWIQGSGNGTGFILIKKANPSSCYTAFSILFFTKLTRLSWEIRLVL